MTLSTLNITEADSDILESVKSKCLRKIQLLEVPTIMECKLSILDQYYFVYYPLGSGI